MALLKFQMNCTGKECGKTAIILIDPEEIQVPNLCPFCGYESVEENGVELRVTED